MGCASCAAARARRENLQFVWTSADGSETITYPSLLQAKAKVHRKGGSYVAVSKT